MDSKRKLACLFALFLGISLSSCQSGPDQSEGVDEFWSQHPALREISRKIEEKPHQASLYFERATILDDMELDSMALIDYQRAIKRDSSRAEYFSRVGDLLFEHQDISGSLPWFEQALKLDPHDPVTHLKLGKLFIYTKEYTSAFKMINKVLRDDVYNPQGYYLKGIAYKDMGRYDEAISSFQTAVQVDPMFRDARIQLGLMFSKKGDDMAITYLEHAYAQDSSDLFPLYAQGVHYQDKKDYVRAKEIYRRLILRDREYINAYMNLGYIYIQEDSLDKAWRHYDLVRKLEPANAEAYYSMGLCHELQGQTEEAAENYRYALQFKPEYPEALEGIARIKP